MFNDTLHDILTEAFNLGVGSAASVLSDLADDEIQLAVPDVKFMNKASATEILDSCCDNKLTGIAQQFKGQLDGTALLLFPSAQSLEMVRLFIRESVPVELLIEFEEEALCEIGNIILNACISCMADLFSHEIDSGLPNYRVGNAHSVLDVNCAKKNETVLFLNISFELKKNEINGYLTFLLDLESIDKLKHLLEEYADTLYPGYSNGQT